MTSRQALERERTFEIGADDPLPDLDGLLRPGRSREHRLRAVYLDTPDLLLIRNGVTLRRREGGHDAGWHAKIPARGGRLEIQEPLTDGPGRWRVPGRVMDAVVAHLGEVWQDRPAQQRGLAPVAVVSNRRTETELCPWEGGEPVAVLCDDRVSTEPAGIAWRELEVELSGAAPSFLLELVTERFAAQGVPMAELASKLGRSLGDRPWRAEQGVGPDAYGPASALVLAHLAEQVAVLRGREEGLAAGDPEAVHKARVATRRLRSTLKTFSRLFEREVTDPLRAEVGWFAGVLGRARDADVVRDRLAHELADGTPGTEEGESLLAALDAERVEARAALNEALASERWSRLLDALTELVADPPWRSLARQPGTEVLPPLVEATIDRVEKSWDTARALTGTERMEALHRTRRRAKATRYAFEAMAPSFGAGAAELATRWEVVTEALGEVQDLEVAVETLRGLATGPAAAAPSHCEALAQRLLDRQPAAVAAGEAALEAALTGE